MTKKIYLDYAASTPVDEEVFKAMTPYFSKNFGNPSSIHSFGQETLAAIDKARENIAQFLGCQTKELIFTSGATEANNFALKGIVKALKLKNNDQPIEIIISRIEHPCVLETAKDLEKQGIKVTYLPVTKDGLISVEKVEKAISERTRLVSIMYANNEVGTVQPIREIGKMIEKINKSRTKTSVRDKKRKEPVIFHSDAVQAAGYLNCSVDWLHVDALSLSGHKIYGPKGIGALYIRSGTPVEPLLHGGEQEYEMRAGTENVAGIVGFGRAIEIVSKSQASAAKKVKNLRDKLIDGVLKNVPKSQLNGSREKRLPNNANFSFEGVEGESIIIALDQEGIASSTGSACSSRALKPSHVLLGMGYTPLRAHSSLRLSLGRQTTLAEINQVLKVLPPIIKRLRDISGRK